MINQLGQASDVFRLLIGMVVGITIFAIIYSLIVQTETSTDYLENEMFFKKLEMAIKNPTGQSYEIENVEVKKSSQLNVYYMSYKTGLGKDCFTLESTTRTDIICTSTMYQFKKDAKLNFSIFCELDDSGDCKVECTLSVK